MYVALAGLAEVSWIAAYARIGSERHISRSRWASPRLRPFSIASGSSCTSTAEIAVNRIFAFVGIFWLGILFALSLSDYRSRNWLPWPGDWPDNPKTSLK